MNKYNAGLAPLVIVLILVAIVVVGGGGVYLATKDNAEVAISPTTTPGSPTKSPVGTKTAPPRATTTQPTVTQAPTASKAPTGTAISFANLLEAYNSGKDIYCAGPIISGSQIMYYISNKKIRYEYHGLPTGKEGPNTGVSSAYYLTGTSYSSYYQKDESATPVLSTSSVPGDGKGYDQFTAKMPTLSLSTYQCSVVNLSPSKFIPPGQ